MIGITYVGEARKLQARLLSGLARRWTVQAALVLPLG
jgi:hypothetical protein